MPSLFHRVSKDATLLRALMDTWFQTLSVEGVVLDLGGGRRSAGYQQLIGGFAQAQVFCLNLYLEDNVHLVCDLERNLPVACEKVNTVIAFNLLEHLWNIQGLVHESCRVLAPSGRLYLATPFLYRVHRDPDDFWRLTDSTLCRLCTQAGFSDTQVIPLEIGPLGLVYDGLEPFLPLRWRGPFLRLVLAVTSWLKERATRGDYDPNYKSKLLEPRYPLGYGLVATK